MVFYLLFNKELRKFKAGTADTIDNLLKKLSVNMSWSVIHFEDHQTKKDAQQRVIDVNSMSYSEKIEHFILNKI